jgi:hypothetical protein
MCDLDLFKEIEKELFAGKAVVFLHAENLGLLADLREKLLAKLGLPMLAAEAENEGAVVNDALKPEVSVSHTEFCLLEACEGNFLLHLKYVVGEDDRRVGQLAEISLKADLLRKDASALTYNELKNLLGIFAVLLTILLFGIIHNFSPLSVIYFLFS